MLKLVKYRGKFAAAYTVPGVRGTKRISLRTTDRTVAEYRLRELKASANRSDLRVREIWNEWRETLKGRPSYKRAGDSEKSLSPFFFDMVPAHITKEISKDYIEKRQNEGVGNGTIIRELTDMRAALRRKKHEYGEGIIMPPSPEPRREFLTRHQFRNFIDAVIAPHVGLFCTLGITLAARKGALLELVWPRVNFETGIIELSTAAPGERRKGRATLPMTKKAREALMGAYEARTCEYVIEWAGKPVANIRKGFEATARRAGLPWVTPHVLRHTAAVWMAQNRVPMSEIAQYLGHSDSRVTERVYARYSPDYLRGPGETLDDW